MVYGDSPGIEMLLDELGLDGVHDEYLGGWGDDFYDPTKHTCPDKAINAELSL